MFQLGAVDAVETTVALLDLQDRLLRIASMPPGEDRDREVRDGLRTAKELDANVAARREAAELALTERTLGGCGWRLPGPGLRLPRRYVP